MNFVIRVSILLVLSKLSIMAVILGSRVVGFSTVAGMPAWNSFKATWNTFKTSAVGELSGVLTLSIWFCKTKNKIEIEKITDRSRSMDSPEL